MDIVWIAIAFLLGLTVRMFGLPPLVGYLAAGFVLHRLDVSGGETLTQFAELGIMLLLFSIGLKLRLGNLARPEVWGVAGLHMAGVVAVLALLFQALAAGALPLFDGLDYRQALIVAFALSFSSTVLAVKVLEEKGELAALYAQVAIGILIIQDVAAVVFLAASAGKLPTLYALGLLALIPLRPVLHWLLERAGHSELLVLYGLCLALGGAELFEAVGMKGDLGALLLGVLLARHPKAAELSKALLSLKDLFLVAFFLSIGLSGMPGPAAAGVAVLLTLLVPPKAALFFTLLTRFRLRARSALLGSLSLASYSEFGLVVMAIAVEAGWLPRDWLVVVALAVSLSFVLAAPLNTGAHALYARLRRRLKGMETGARLPEEELLSPGDASVVIMGMGRVGTGAYEYLRERFGEWVVGIDFNPEAVEHHRRARRNVIRGSATDPDFWSRFDLSDGHVAMVLLAMPNEQENIHAARQLRASGYRGRIAAIAKYPDEVDRLRAAGVDHAFNLYAEAGAGFAQHVFRDLEEAPS